MFVAAPGDGTAAEFLFGSYVDGQSITRDSVTNGGAVPVDFEVADDFTVMGEIQRLLIHGFDCFNCAGALSSGVIVRLYEQGRRRHTGRAVAGGQVFVMHYDGTSWQDVAAPISSGGNDSWIRGIKVLGPNDVWFVGDWVGATQWNGPTQTALAMHWNGSTFTLKETPSPGFGTPGWSLEAGSGAVDDLWAVGGGSDGDPASDTYFVHWNGSQWQVSQPELPGDTKRFSHMLSLGSTHVYWNGATWEVQPRAPDVIGALLSDIEQTGPCNASAVGSQQLAGVRRPLIANIKPIIFHCDLE